MWIQIQRVRLWSECPHQEFLDLSGTELGTCAPNHHATITLQLHCEHQGQTNKSELHCLYCQVFLEQMSATGVQPFELDSGTIISRLRNKNIKLLLLVTFENQYDTINLGILPRKPN